MFDAAARKFLQQPLIARLTVIDAEGYPHTVPVWFYLDGDAIVFISARDTRKVAYALLNARASVQIGGEAGQVAGYMIKGDLAVEEDADLAWLRRVTYHYEDEAQAAQDVAAWAELDMIVLRLTPRHVIKVA